MYFHSLSAIPCCFLITRGIAIQQKLSPSNVLSLWFPALSIKYKLDDFEDEILIKHLIQYLHKTKNHNNNKKVNLCQ